MTNYCSTTGPTSFSKEKCEIVSERPLVGDNVPRMWFLVVNSARHLTRRFLEQANPFLQSWLTTTGVGSFDPIKQSAPTQKIEFMFKLFITTRLIERRKIEMESFVSAFTAAREQKRDRITKWNKMSPQSRTLVLCSLRSGIWWATNSSRSLMLIPNTYESHH